MALRQGFLYSLQSVGFSGSPVMVHHILTDDWPEVEKVPLAISYVSSLVCQKLKQGKVDQGATFLESTQGDHACSTMLGQLFKKIVRNRQSGGVESKHAVK